MRKAIDNYAMGKQIEVTAWKGSSIPASSGRFFCPECMESVALDIRGHFRHKNRTAQSMECEKRVDSPNRTSYERMGLPLFIKEEAPSQFRLYIGFPALSAELLEKTTKLGSSLEIGNGLGAKVKLMISSERFDSDHITYIPLDFLPSNDTRYTITYNSAPSIVESRWTTQSDLWGKGQFFKYSDNFSRKVRPLGNLISDQSYYYIGDTWFLQHYKNFVDIVQAGRLSIGRTTVCVYRIIIHASRASTNAFQNLSSYLMEKYHLSLLIGDSRITPLWPPCVIDENYFIFPTETSTALFVVDSPNERPVIFKYEGHNYFEVPLGSQKPAIYTVRPTETDLPISVDRAFNGNIQYIRRQKLHTFATDNTVDILDENGSSIIDAAMTHLRNKEFFVTSTCACTVFHIRENGEDTQYQIKSEAGITIRNPKWEDAIIAITNAGNLLLSFVFERKRVEHQDDDSHFLKRIRNARGRVIPINDRILALFKQACKEPPIYRELTKYIRLGAMPEQVVTLLSERFGGK